jgi:REP element-mobilizing transposase RayT
MAQSLSRILLHVVFSTKQRQPWIDDSLRPRLHAYLAGACRQVGSEAYRVGGTEDHIHIACMLPRTVTASKLMTEIKASSSAWVKKECSKLSLFAWQAGYGVFSLGQSQLPALLRYIDNQRDHHRSRTFQEEMREIVRRYQAEHNEEHMWD